jgi:Tol biopolymer transport system component
MPLRPGDAGNGAGAGARAGAIAGDPTVALAAAPPAGDPAGPQRVLDHELTNDDMDDALVITSLPFAARTNDTRATRQRNEPDDCARTGDTAWYRYTAPRDGQLTADTFGTDHAVTMGVFHSSGRGLERVGCSAGPRGGAHLGFPVQQGRTYLFQLTRTLAGGRLVFHLAGLGRTLQASTDVPGRVGEKLFWSDVSADGRFVAFNSRPVDTCGSTMCPGQVYVTDRQTGRTELVSRGLNGGPGNNGSVVPSLSDDGRYVGFSSAASNLILGDSNNVPDYFVHDRRTGRTVRASVSSNGSQGSTTSGYADQGIAGHISQDGRYATFHSVLNGLVDGDMGETIDIFVHDLATGRTTLENLDSQGNRGVGRKQAAFEPRISRDGRYVSFLSGAHGLAPARYSACPVGATICLNVFLRDRLLGTTRILSVDRHGNADMQANRQDMSSDGAVVAWSTTSALGDPRDTNGVSDIFVARRGGGGHPVRVSLSSAGEQQNDPGGSGLYTDRFSLAGSGRYVAVSGDGRRIAFDSRATNLVPGDDNSRTDVFLRDLADGTTTRVSTPSRGGDANGDSYRPSLSFDGRVVAFESDAEDLAAEDGNGLRDIFVHDLRGV